jgi:hypothetical protein
MDLRSRLTYANVVATLALVLAIGGGTVYAALQLGKNDVKSKNIAKGAVKTSDLHANAVTSPKLKDGTIAGDDIQDATITGQKLQDGTIAGQKLQDATIAGQKLQDGTITGQKLQDATITADDIAAGVIPELDADVTGSATGGPQGGINANTTTPLTLSGTTSFTPKAGDVAALAAEAQFTLATTNPANSCSPAVLVPITGQQTGLFVNSDQSVVSTTPVQSFGRDADGPYGLLNPGTPISFTAQLVGDADCTAGSQLDRVEIKIVQIR